MKMNSLMSGFLVASSIVVSTSALAGNIVHSKVLAVQVHNAAHIKMTKIYFDGKADVVDKAETAKCKTKYGNGEDVVFATITHGLHDEFAVDQMTNIALAAQASGKKVRAYSYENDSCEADMISIQDIYL